MMQMVYNAATGETDYIADDPTDDATAELPMLSDADRLTRLEQVVADLALLQLEV